MIQRSAVARAAVAAVALSCAGCSGASFPTLTHLFDANGASLAADGDDADRAVAALSDEMVAAATARRTGVYVLRAEHRQEHLDEIERALGGP